MDPITAMTARAAEVGGAIGGAAGGGLFGALGGRLGGRRGGARGAQWGSRFWKLERVRGPLLDALRPASSGGG